MLSFISYLPRKTPATKILKLSLVLPVPLKRIVLSDSTSTNMLPYEAQKGQRIKIVANDCNPNIEIVHTKVHQTAILNNETQLS